ncbi:hypothetical protein THAOC_14687 [Thalassiosira oceanica]|uniref:Uncharacterized protein n=1 Tax=Thalassiosira oceanica TaxID=159749 RepID=K0SEM0_THAOC|nr:hypothetical protein THAOC_14687 [Thalassiosira oceanica]|eukprot:EJK64568.1 hypothetical protein THAOC_14687 [Thalassiosira oceanica]
MFALFKQQEEVAEDPSVVSSLVDALASFNDALSEQIAIVGTSILAARENMSPQLTYAVIVLPLFLLVTIATVFISRPTKASSKFEDGASRSLPSVASLEESEITKLTLMLSLNKPPTGDDSSQSDCDAGDDISDDGSVEFTYQDFKDATFDDEVSELADTPSSTPPRSSPRRAASLRSRMSTRGLRKRLSSLSARNLVKSDSKSQVTAEVSK